MPWKPGSRAVTSLFLISLLLVLVLSVAPGCSRRASGAPGAGGAQRAAAEPSAPLPGTGPAASEPARVTSTYPGPGSVVGIFKVVHIKFDRPVSPEVIRNAVRLEPAIPYKLTFADDAAILLFQGLPPGGVTFSLTVDGPGVEPFRSSFQTAEAVDGHRVLDAALRAFDSAREFAFSMYEGPFFVDDFYPFDELWDSPGAGAGAWGSEGRLAATSDAWYSESTEDNAAEVFRLDGRFFARHNTGWDQDSWSEITGEGGSDPALAELAHLIATPREWGGVRLLRHATEVRVLGTEQRDGREVAILAVASPALEPDGERAWLSYDLRATIDQADGRLLAVDFQVLRSVGQEAGFTYSYWTGRCTYEYAAGPIVPPPEVLELLKK